MKTTEEIYNQSAICNCSSCKEDAIKTMQEYASQFFTKEDMEKAFDAGKDYVRDYEYGNTSKYIDFEKFMQQNYPEK